MRGRLDHPIDYAENPAKTANPKYTEADLQAMVDVMEYATNKNKTEQRFFVTGVNCDPTTARDEMMIAKVQWSDTSEIVCYHGFQSFKHGEVTPEQAHEVGVKLAERMWGDRFQVIVATHLNTDCLHNHFVVNSVSFAVGMHYHDNKANLRLLRQRSDELCREYALSVIEHPSGKKKPYALYQAEKQGRPTRDNVARQAVDEAISKSFTLKDFDRQLAEMGYRINFDPNRKYWTIIGKGWQRPKRLYKLGEEYTNDRIMERISGQIPELLRATAAGQGLSGQRFIEERQENRRLAWAVSPLLLQARYPAKRQKTKLCTASLSLKGRPYEDGSHHTGNKAALPQSH